MTKNTLLNFVEEISLEDGYIMGMDSKRNGPMWLGIPDGEHQEVTLRGLGAHLRRTNTDDTPNKDETEDLDLLADIMVLYSLMHFTACVWRSS